MAFTYGSAAEIRTANSDLPGMVRENQEDMNRIGDVEKSLLQCAGSVRRSGGTLL